MTYFAILFKPWCLFKKCRCCCLRAHSNLMEMLLFLEMGSHQSLCGWENPPPPPPPANRLQGVVDARDFWPHESISYWAPKLDQSSYDASGTFGIIPTSPLLVCLIFPFLLSLVLPHIICYISLLCSLPCYIWYTFTHTWPIYRLLSYFLHCRVTGWQVCLNPSSRVPSQTISLILFVSPLSFSICPFFLPFSTSVFENARDSFSCCHGYQGPAFKAPYRKQGISISAHFPPCIYSVSSIYASYTFILVLYNKTQRLLSRLAGGGGGCGCVVSELHSENLLTWPALQLHRASAFAITAAPLSLRPRGWTLSVSRMAARLPASCRARHRAAVLPPSPMEHRNFPRCGNVIQRHRRMPICGAYG